MVLLVSQFPTILSSSVFFILFPAKETRYSFLFTAPIVM